VHESRPTPAGGPGQAAPIPGQLLKVTSRSLIFMMLFTYLLTRAVIIPGHADFHARKPMTAAPAPGRP
jgi:hypothetical protein